MVSIVQLTACLGVFAPLSLAFSNTGKLILNPLGSTSLIETHKIVKTDKLENVVLEETKNMCLGSGTIYVYQVDELITDKGYNGMQYDNVFYPDQDNANFTSAKIAEECEVRYFKHYKSISMIEILKFHQDSDNVIVQTIPSFKTKGSLDNIKEKVYDLYNDEDIIIEKRSQEEDDEARIEEEIEQDFKEAESLASEETNPVNILDTDKDKPNNGTIIKHDNLFTKYQFFTPGIWSGIIVSLFLLTILYGALSWLTSLEITYSSFEKQVDYDKKNE